MKPEDIAKDPEMVAQILREVSRRGTLTDFAMQRKYWLIVRTDGVKFPEYRDNCWRKVGNGYRYKGKGFVVNALLGNIFYEDGGWLRERYLRGTSYKFYKEFNDLFKNGMIEVQERLAMEIIIDKIPVQLEERKK